MYPVITLLPAFAGFNCYIKFFVYKLVHRLHTIFFNQTGQSVVSEGSVVMLDLIHEERVGVQGVDVGAHIYSLTEPARDLRILLQNPMVTISFAQYLQDDKAISLERAIQKLTSLPAGRIALRERGVLRKGLPADIVVFNPLAPSHGMNYVFVNGTLVVKDGERTEARPGEALR